MTKKAKIETLATRRAHELIDGEEADGTDAEAIGQLLKLQGLQYQPVYHHLQEVARKQTSEVQERSPKTKER